MSKAYKQAARDLKSGNIAPLYIISGEEEWSRMKFLELLKKTVVDPSMEDFNYEHFQANEVKGVAVADKAGSLPVMADWRLVVVENCSYWKKKDLDGVTQYLDRINDKACLVLQFDTIDKRKKLFQSKSPQVRYLSFPKPKPWELQEYIYDLSVDMKLKLSKDVCALIAELGGDDLALIHRELEKMSLFRLDSNEISPQDVEALMGRTRQATRWELNDFIGKRDLPGALMKMHHIMESGEDAISLLSAINAYIKQLYTVKALMIRGIKDTRQIGQALRLPPKIAERLINQQRSFSNYELRSAFAGMLDADLMIKSAGINRKLIIDNLLCRIINRGPMSPPAPRGRR